MQIEKTTYEVSMTEVIKIIADHLLVPPEVVSVEVTGSTFKGAVFVDKFIVTVDNSKITEELLIRKHQ